jgi:predicted RNA-binding protein
MKGLLFFDALGLARPEILRHRKKLQNWLPSSKSNILVLLPPPHSKPFHNSREFKKIKQVIIEKIGSHILNVDFCFYAAPFGIIPLELDEVYPLSQFEISIPIDRKIKQYVMEQIKEYLLRPKKKYKHVILHPSYIFGKQLIEICKKTCQELGIAFQTSTNEGKIWGNKAIEDLIKKNLDVLQ